MNSYSQLTKSGIVLFVLVTGMMGFCLSAPHYQEWDNLNLVMTLVSLYLLSSGSFAINQAQEWKIDARMPRTEQRPLPQGKITPAQAYVLGGGYVLIGAFIALVLNPLMAVLGIATVVFYNLFYTLLWKKRWAFGAVPGAIPGAMPVVIGYAANTSELFNSELIYAFLIMFLWQMPHFWALAIRFKEDYSKGGIPVLPVKLGTERTLFHIGLYVFAYVGLAIASPLFTPSYWFYLLAVLPMAFMVVVEFWKYFLGGGREKWIRFFLWVNASVLVFLLAPVLDKWYRILWPT